MSIVTIRDWVYDILGSIHNLMNYILKDKFEFTKKAKLLYPSVVSLYDDNMVFEVLYTNYPYEMNWTHIKDDGSRYVVNKPNKIGILKTQLNCDLRYKAKYR
jgi:hypothetical protein